MEEINESDNLIQKEKYDKDNTDANESKDFNLNESKNNLHNSSLINQTKKLDQTFNAFGKMHPKDLLDSITYSEYQFNIIFLSLFLLIIEGANISLVPYLIVSLRNYLEVNTFQIEVTSSIIYVGLGL